jgi:hypothetical protein
MTAVLRYLFSRLKPPGSNLEEESEELRMMV